MDDGLSLKACGGSARGCSKRLVGTSTKTRDLAADSLQMQQRTFSDSIFDCTSYEQGRFWTPFRQKAFCGIISAVSGERGQLCD